MSFSQRYPVSSFYYDPAIQPTKPIANLQAQDENNMRKIPKGRYDTTYRREYLNFANGYPSSGNSTLDNYLTNKPPPPAHNLCDLNNDWSTVHVCICQQECKVEYRVTLCDFNKLY